VETEYNILIHKILNQLILGDNLEVLKCFSSGLVGAIATAFFSSRREMQSKRKESAQRCFLAVHYLKNSLTSLFNPDFIDSLLPLKGKSERSTRELLSRILTKDYVKDYLSEKNKKYYEALTEFKAFKHLDFYIASKDRKIYIQYQSILKEIDSSVLLKAILNVLGDFYSLSSIMSDSQTENIFLLLPSVSLDPKEYKRKINQDRLKNENVLDLQNKLYDLLSKKLELEKQFQSFMNKIGELEELCVKAIDSQKCL
jgi:hypothetical protein